MVTPQDSLDIAELVAFAEQSLKENEEPGEAWGGGLPTIREEQR